MRAAGGFAFGLALLTAGCGSVSLVDNVDVQLDFHALSGPSDSLHTPYVQGASMRVYVQSSHNDDMTRWTIESSDASVFSVDGTGMLNKQLYADCTAARAGRVTIIVRDGNKDEQHRATVEVKLPDRIDLMAHGRLMIGRAEKDAVVDELRLRRGGTATFLARYSAGGQTLYGNGALGADAAPEVDALPRRTYFNEDRDWLVLTPLTGSTNGVVTLRAGGTRVLDVPLVVVDDAAIAGVRIDGQDESRAKDGQWLWALAQAFDAGGQPIFGVAFSWDVDGQSALGTTGDLYHYQFQVDKPKMLAASFNGVSNVARIHAGAGYVSSSNFLGCSAAPGGAPTGRGAAFVLVLFFALVRARRSAF
jgi:MYXO-CTERM domain-containing protein